MHGNGNDFVVLDYRGSPLPLPSAVRCQAMADRHRGIGCDQVIILVDAEVPNTQAHVRFFNQDGSESGACGNGARCVAWLLANPEQLPAVVHFTTPAAVHEAHVTSQDEIRLSMGAYTQNPYEIPLAPSLNPMAVDVGIPELGLGIAVGMGNPHVVFFVDNMDQHDLGRLGPLIEHHEAFPERVNVHVVQQTGPHSVRQKIWERGTGETLSCGSGACAVAVAGCLTGLWSSRVLLDQPGGTLICDVQGNGHVMLTGPVREAFSGIWNQTL